MAQRKSRSPRHPRHNLQNAIERIKKVYYVEHTHFASREVVAEALGYRSLNGSAAKWISTLKNYALLEEGKDGLRVSDDAVALIELPEEAPERMDTLRHVAFAPELFTDLRNTFEDRLPSDANLRHFLITSKGFLPTAVDGVIRVYRDNIDFVSKEVSKPDASEHSGAKSSETARSQEQVATMSDMQAHSLDATVTPESMVLPERNSMKEFLHVFAKGCEMRLLTEGTVTQEAIEKLIAYLELGKEDLPLIGQLEQSGTENSDHSNG